MPVARDPPASLIVNPCCVLFEKALHFGLQRCLQHLPGSFPDQCVQRTAPVVQAWLANRDSLGVAFRRKVIGLVLR